MFICLEQKYEWIEISTLFTFLLLFLKNYDATENHCRRKSSFEFRRVLLNSSRVICSGCIVDKKCMFWFYVVPNGNIQILAAIKYIFQRFKPVANVRITIQENITIPTIDGAVAKIRNEIFHILATLNTILRRPLKRWMEKGENIQTATEVAALNCSPMSHNIRMRIFEIICMQ